MGKIGILGGTFDPIHFGHINLALELMERHSLDKVLFVPALINPHKLNQKPASFQDRFSMIQKAIKDIPQFEVNDIEAHLPSPSYTINTVEFLIKKDKETNQFYLLLGEDSIPGFFKWHRVEELVKLIPLLIGSRTYHNGKDHSDNNPLIVEAIRKGVTPTPLMDISGTDLRHRFSKKLYCGHLVPHQVLDYIFKKKLYEQ